MAKAWHAPVTLFALYNLIAVPIVGRAAWLAMQMLHGDGLLLAAVALSVVAALGILAGNVVLTLRAARAGVPEGGRTALWAITGLTFVLTIGTGFYSPLTLLQALVTS